MSEREFTKWLHYFRHEPTEGDRLEYMIAMLCAVTLNATGRMKKPAKADDFLPKWGPKPKQTVPDMVGRFKAAVEMAKARKAHAKARADAKAKRLELKRAGRTKAPAARKD